MKSLRLVNDFMKQEYKINKKLQEEIFKWLKNQRIYNTGVTLLNWKNLKNPNLYDLDIILTIFNERLRINKQKISIIDDINLIYQLENYFNRMFINQNVKIVMFKDLISLLGRLPLKKQKKKLKI